MNKLALAVIALGALPGCSVVGGALIGDMLNGRDGFYPSDVAVSSAAHGSGVVCLGTDGEAADSLAFDLRGRVVADTDFASFAGVVDNVFPCAQDPSRVLVIEDADGQRWNVGYAWLSDGWDSTPWMNVQSGQVVEVTLRRGASPDSVAAALAVRSPRGLVYALEAGHGEPAFGEGDVQGLSISAPREVARIDGDCGDEVALAVDFSSDSSDLTLMPGSDAGFEVDGEYLTTCSIAAYEIQDCEEDASSEVSWIMFR